MTQTRIWYALMVKPSQDVKAYKSLMASGLEAFLPVEYVTRRSRYMKTEKETMRPLVRGYVFASRPATDNRHIRGVLMIDGKPHPIPDSALQSLLFATGKTVAQGKPPIVYSIGDLIRITTGPFTGKTAKVARIRGIKYDVEIPLLGGPRAVKIDRASLEAMC
jgi:transcription antitermination factor NusG